MSVWGTRTAVVPAGDCLPPRQPFWWDMHPRTPREELLEASSKPAPREIIEKHKPNHFDLRKYKKYYSSSTQSMPGVKKIVSYIGFVFVDFILYLFGFYTHFYPPLMIYFAYLFLNSI